MLSVNSVENVFSFSASPSSLNKSTAPASAASEWRSFWYLPVVAALGYATSVLHVNSIGLFIAPLQEEFGWSRAQASSGLTVAALLTAVFCIPGGILVDRIGPRRVGLIGVLAMSAAYALLGSTTGEMTHWLALWSIVAVAAFWVQGTVWTSAVASRFERSRGLAFAITLSGASFGATVIPLLTSRLIGAYGWRTAFVGLGALWAAFVFPILLLCFRGAQDPRRSTQIATSKPANVQTGLTLAEGLRSPVFYKLLIAGGLFAFTVVGAGVHFVPILTDSGATPLAAANVAALIGVSSIVGRLGTGVLLDRLPGYAIGALASLLPIIACTLLLNDGADAVSQTIAALALGLTVGSEVDVIAYLAAKHFGLRNFGALYGALVMALALGTAFGPLAAGAAFDRYGSYAPFLVLTMALMATSAIALLSVGSATPKAAAAA